MPILSILRFRLPTKNNVIEGQSRRYRNIHIDSLSPQLRRDLGLHEQMPAGKHDRPRLSAGSLLDLFR
ncbi:hypothetical protein [Nitratireductor soli]|uniref:hypothetical protein n=1 Tax=Nitratireductor soli TaxID=1670619 RepID=UPI00065E48B2|nr:hypothetical protein [Nitratireductor soli]